MTVWQLQCYLDQICMLQDDMISRLQKKSRAKYALHKFFFTNKVVNIWNSLPEYVVHKLFQKSSRQILVSSGTDI